MIRNMPEYKNRLERERDGENMVVKEAKAMIQDAKILADRVE